ARSPARPSARGVSARGRRPWAWLLAGPVTKGHPPPALRVRRTDAASPGLAGPAKSGGTLSHHPLDRSTPRGLGAARPSRARLAPILVHLEQPPWRGRRRRLGPRPPCIS